MEDKWLIIGVLILTALALATAFKGHCAGHDEHARPQGTVHRAGSAKHTNTHQSDRVGALAEVASFPFHDNFESGTNLGPEWTTYTTADGHVWLDKSNYTYQGSYSLLLEDQVPDDVCSHAAAILTIDLSGQSNVFLDFWWREFKDEDHPHDGVFISDDDGVNWHLAFSFNDGPQDYAHEVVDIAAAAKAHGLSLNDHFQIKLQFYDDYWLSPLSVNSDGYAIDEVRVYSPLPTYVPLVLRTF